MSSHPFVVLPLFADMGLPMIVLTWPAMAMLLLPVIVIEGLLCKKWLGLPTWQAIKTNAASNLASTIIGIPVAWAVMLAIEFGAMALVGESNALQNWRSPIANVIFFLLSSAWLNPDLGERAWFIPAATLVLLIPFFLASYWIEYLVVRRMVGMPTGDPPNLAYPRVRLAVRNANLVTYGVMFVATSIWLAVLLRHPSRTLSIERNLTTPAASGTLRLALQTPETPSSNPCFPDIARPPH